MKKIINYPEDFVNESIQGLVISYPDIYKFSSETNKVLMRSKKSSNKVVIILTTHDVSGLSDKDLILGEFIDNLYEK